MPGLLVHVCCAPCAAFPLERLLARPDPPAPLVAWFYNPNIHPLEEHHRRRDAVAYLAARIGSEGASLAVDFSPPYEPRAFLDAVALAPDAPGRCRICYGLRLGAAAREARRRSMAFTTTLLYSRRQRHELVVEAGREAAQREGAEFVYEDWRTGWSRGVELSRSLGLYRQRWCGCVYEAGDR